jgi:hypothetical protein
MKIHCDLLGGCVENVPLARAVGALAGRETSSQRRVRPEKRKSYAALLSLSDDRKSFEFSNARVTFLRSASNNRVLDWIGNAMAPDGKGRIARRSWH